MKLLIKKYKRIIPILLVIILLAVFIPQNQVSADWCITPSGCVQQATIGILGIMRGFLLKAIAVFASLLDSFIHYQTESAVYNVGAVDGSWTIIRNFVNLFFILILIVIAFGTIFDIKKYTWQDLLPSFIIAALLINFSLTIGQYIITVSNGLSGVFLKQIGSVSDNFAQGFSQVKIVTSDINPASAAMSGYILIITDLAFSLIFYVIIALAFASAAIFSIVRLFALWFLLILSPIAWIGYTWPAKKAQTWGKWWTNFLCWCFFLPYYLFFMMFAVIFIGAKDKFPALSGTSIAGLVGNEFLVYCLSLIFLIGGLWVAMQLACASGTGVKAAFGKIEGGVRKYAPGAAYLRGGVAGLKARGEQIAEKGILGIGGAQKGRLQEATAKGLVAGIPGLGKVPGAREEASRAQVAGVDKEVKRLQLLNLTLDQLNERLIKGSSPEKLAAFKIKAENGWLEANDLSNINKILGDAGGGKTAMGASILASLKKGKFQEMAQTTAQKEFIFNNLNDRDVKKAFGLDMAESREIMNEDIAKSLLDLYSGDTKEVQTKVAEAVKNNIENIARDAGARKNLINATGAFVGADPRLRALAGKIITEKKEVNSWKLRNQVLELNGGINPATGEALTVEGRGLAKDIADGNVAVKEEADYRKGHPAILATTDLDPTQRNDLENQVIENIKNGQIRSLNAEDLTSPAVFNALFNGRNAGTLTPAEFNKALGVKKVAGTLEITGKPDRKKRKAINDIVNAAAPMPYP